jgi:Tol biopolymer transport system component
VSAGAVFIAIGIASAIYSNIPVSVSVDGTVRPKAVDILTPDMNTGNTAHITFAGDNYTVIVKDPDNKVIASHNSSIASASAPYVYDLTAEKDGQYNIETHNLGNSTVNITGNAQTKSSPLGFSGALMLAITGIVLIGLAVRVKGSR